MKLIHGDCLEVLKTIQDNSVDFILTDLPYGTTECSWDIILPFEIIWPEMLRVLKPNSVIALFGSEPFSTLLRSKNLKHFKYDWILEKSQGVDFQNANKRPMRKHELCSIFMNGKTKYFPQGLIETNKKKSNSKNGKSGLTRIRTDTKEHIQKFTNYPTSIIPFPKQQNKLHPTQKPVELLEYLIKTYTKEGETVLDFTMGSGSTGVACKNLNREFIGIEKDEKYFNIAKDRLK